MVFHCRGRSVRGVRQRNADSPRGGVPGFVDGRVSARRMEPRSVSSGHSQYREETRKVWNEVRKEGLIERREGTWEVLGSKQLRVVLESQFVEVTDNYSRTDGSMMTRRKQRDRLSGLLVGLDYRRFAPLTDQTLNTPSTTSGMETSCGSGGTATSTTPTSGSTNRCGDFPFGFYTGALYQCTARLMRALFRLTCKNRHRATRRTPGPHSPSAAASSSRRTTSRLSSASSSPQRAQSSGVDPHWSGMFGSAPLPSRSRTAPSRVLPAA